MKLVEIRDLRKQNTVQLRKELQDEREIILAVNRRPFAMMTSGSPDTVEREVSALRRARAQIVVGEIRAQAKKTGASRLTMRQIDAIIANARAERRAKEDMAKTKKRVAAKKAK